MNNVKQVNKEYVLKDLEGNYNFEVHKKLTQIIHNTASNLIATNPYLTVDDIEQEAWCRVIEIVNKNLEAGRELEISYLVRTAQTASLGYCIKQSKKNDKIDARKSSALNGFGCSSDISPESFQSSIEYDVGVNDTEYDDCIRRLALEEVICKIDDKPVRDLIVIKYIKEFGGTSSVIIHLFDEFYESLPADRKCILDNMEKFTANAAFRAMGMRDTDNESTRIRKQMKEALKSLISYI